MANFSDYLRNALEDHVFRTSSYSKPGTIAIALCSGVPTSSNTGANLPELPNANGYTRWVLGAPADNVWIRTAAGVMNNGSGIAWPAASAQWGWVSGIAFLDSATIGAGNVLMQGALSVAKFITQNDVFTIPSGNEVITYV